MIKQTLRLLQRLVNSGSHSRVWMTAFVLAAMVLQMAAPVAGMSLVANGLPDLSVNLNTNPFGRYFEASAAPKSYQQTLQAMPMSFVQNSGQIDARVKFTARGRGYSLFLTPDEAVMTLQQAKAGRATALRMQLLHANSDPIISGLDKLAMVSNYYVGNDPARFRENVAHYAKVKYEQVYPGIDAVYYGKQQELEYDFIVAPGADPHQIAMQFTGANALRLAANGDLVISTEGGELRHHKPIIYQNINNQRVLIEGSFIISQRNRVSFAVGDYDSSRELVIDPTLNYSTYLGGYEGDEKALSVTVEPGCAGACAAYITGEVASLTFPDTNITTGSAGGKDIFVAKMNAAGTIADFFTFIGGTGDDVGRGIKTDAAGNSYLTGLIGSGFATPGGVTGLQTTDPSAGTDDAFVARLSPTGALVNFTFLGGNNLDQANGIVLKGTDVCVAGQTMSSDFPMAAAYDASHNGYQDAFVSVLNNDLSALTYSTYLGGANLDYGNGIDTYDGKLYVVGNTQSSNFPVAAAFDNKLTGFAPVDAFVARIDPTTGAAGLLSSTYLGGHGREYGFGIAINQANGQFFVTGRSHSPGANTTGYTATSNGFPVTSSAFQSTQVGGGDVFLTRFNPAGSNIIYSTLLGGSGFDVAYGIQVNGAQVYLTGETDSSSAGIPFPLLNPFQTDQPGTDAFVVRINTNIAGAAGLVFATYYGGGDSDAVDSTDSGRAIALAGATVYVVGFTNSFSTASGGTFPVLPAVPYQEDLAFGLGNFDAFVTRMNTN